MEELEDSDDNKTKQNKSKFMIMFMKNVMIKTKILTKQVQSVNINIVDTLLNQPFPIFYSALLTWWWTKGINNLIILLLWNFLNAMESMLMTNTGDIIVTDAQQEEWTKDQKRQKTLSSRICTENNSSKFSTCKQKSLPTTLKRHVIFSPRQLTFSFLHSTMIPKKKTLTLS